MDFLTFENREQDLPALMLLAVSLHRSCPEAFLHVPAQKLGEEALNWLCRIPNVVLHHDLWAKDTHWNIKPYLLEQLLARGPTRVTWLDADLIVTADPRAFFSGLSDETIVVAPEGFRSRFAGSGGRTISIGRSIARDLGFSVNSCVVSITADHLPLLESWKSYMRSDRYQAADKRFVVGDQDVLCGLLGSSEFQQVPIKALRSGCDIAHEMLHGDFTTFQRIATLRRGEPCFVHAQGKKTWHYAKGSANAKSIRSQLSLYRNWAKAYSSTLPPEKTGWITDDGLLARMMVWLAPRRPSLRGLPLGLMGSVLNVAYILRNKLRRNPIFHVGQTPDGGSPPSLT